MHLSRRRVLQSSAIALFASTSPMKTAFGQPGLEHEPFAFESASKALSALRSRDVSAHELTRLCLDRIAATSDSINAVASLREEQALAEARRIDDARAAGDALGPLAGLPVTL